MKISGKKTKENPLILRFFYDLSLLYCMSIPRDKDKVTDYSKADLERKFRKLHNEETWLIFWYDKIARPRRSIY